MGVDGWMLDAFKVLVALDQLRGHERNAVNRYSINELGDLPLATWLADLV